MKTAPATPGAPPPDPSQEESFVKKILKGIADFGSAVGEKWTEWRVSRADTLEEVLRKRLESALGKTPPERWPIPLLKKVIDFLRATPEGLKALGPIVQSALKKITPDQLREILKGTRVELLDSRYTLKKSLLISKINYGKRVYQLTSRYELKGGPFMSALSAVTEKLPKRTEGQTASAFALEQARALAEQARKLGLTPAGLRNKLKHPEAYRGRISMSRYTTKGAINRQVGDAVKDLIAGVYAKENISAAEKRRLLTNPRAMMILARKLTGGKPVTKDEALKIYKKITEDLAPKPPKPRVANSRYTAFKRPRRLLIRDAIYAVLKQTKRKLDDFNASKDHKLIEQEWTKKEYPGAPPKQDEVQAVLDLLRKGSPRIGVSRYAFKTEKNVFKQKEKMNKEAFIRALVEGFEGEQGPTVGTLALKATNVLTKGKVSKAAREALRRRLMALNLAAAIKMVAEIKDMNNADAELSAFGINSINNRKSTEELMRIREEYGNLMGPSARSRLNTVLGVKAARDAAALRTMALESSRLRSWAQHFTRFPENKGKTEFIEALRAAIRYAAGNRDPATGLRRLRTLRSNASGLPINRNIESAERQIRERLTRNQNERRRLNNMNRASRGLPPLPRNRGIPYYPNQSRSRGSGNMFPTFNAPANRPQYSAMPRPTAQQPPMPIMANAGRQAAPQAPFPSAPPLPIENILPPGEKNAVANAGGANKAINLVENAGGPSNVVKTANLLKNVGGSPEAAVAAGANAKNVKIVLQLGGPNNALKVASAVPKLKKRRRSKKKVSKKKAPKPARVKEIKKLLGFLGAKENLQKKLPNKENRAKKLTKKEIVGKLTRFLLRK